VITDASRVAAVALLAFVGYWSTLQVPVSGDASAHVYAAYSVVREGNVDLDEYGDQQPPLVYFWRDIGGHRYAPYLPGNTALFVPFALAGTALGVEPISLGAVGVLSKLAASLYVAISVGAVYVALRTVVDARVATYLSLAYAFGTYAFAVASQVYWEHAPTLMLTAIALALVSRAPSAPRAAAYAGLFAGAAVAVRPTNAFVAAALLATLARVDSRVALRYVLWGVPAAAFLVTFDWLAYGSPFEVGRGPFLPGDLLTGTAGLLFSPSRGLLVYGPWIALGLAALAFSWRGPGDHVRWTLRFGSLAVAAIIVLFGSYAEWWAGWSYGNRYLSDPAPLYVLGVADAFRRGWLTSAVARAALAVAIGWSVLLQAIGAGLNYFYWRGLHWDAQPDITYSTQRLWDWGNAQWQFLFARLILEPPAAMTVELLSLTLIIIAFALLGGRRVQARMKGAMKSSNVARM